MKRIETARDGVWLALVCATDDATAPMMNVHRPLALIQTALPSNGHMFYLLQLNRWVAGVCFGQLLNANFSRLMPADYSSLSSVKL